MAAFLEEEKYDRFPRIQGHLHMPDALGVLNFFNLTKYSSLI
jgi:hypothetical protein